MNFHSNRTMPKAQGSVIELQQEEGMAAKTVINPYVT